jgi:hypothetical protein
LGRIWEKYVHSQHSRWPTMKVLSWYPCFYWLRVGPCNLQTIAKVRVPHFQSQILKNALCLLAWPLRWFPLPQPCCEGALGNPVVRLTCIGSWLSHWQPLPICQTMIEQPWKWIFQPQLSLLVTTALVNILTADL